LNAKGSPISHEQSMGSGRWDFNTGIIQYHLVVVVMWFPLEFLAVICDGLLLLSVIMVLAIVHSFHVISFAGLPAAFPAAMTNVDLPGQVFRGNLANTH
jgi:hypothetical protein